MKLTVLVFAYNHEPFIRQALDSILAQQTGFDFEILISEDCSTDATRQIVTQYAETHPGKIRLLLSPENLHSPLVVERGLDAARGKFVALLDGDDYWTSPHKLQKQLDFMESHPELTVSWHNGVDVDREGRPIQHQETVTVSRTRVDLRTMLQHPIAAIPMSVMIKRSAALPIPLWYRDCPIGDHPLWVLCLRSGIAGHLDEVLGEYRVHSGGLMNGRNLLGRHDLLVRTYQCYLQNLDPVYRPIVSRRLARLWQGMAAMQRQAGNFSEGRKAAKDGLKDCPGDVRLWIFAYMPWIWAPLRWCAGLFLRPRAR